VKVIVLLGAPGAGKGTQAGLIASRLGAAHVSTGALLRSEISSGSLLGAKVKAIVESGSLVDDVTLFECCSGVLSKAQSEQRSILLLDGVPRNIRQVSLLDSVLDKLGLKVDAAIDFEIPEKLLLARLSQRWTCQKCGAVAAGNSEGLAPSSCSSCGSVGAYVKRVDDQPASVSRRLEVYANETAPVSDFYGERAVLHRIDANREPEWVYLDVGAVITKNLK